jgi:hypothetical protein
MSTRIDSVTFLRPERSTLNIDPRDAKKLLDKYDGDLPENCFLRELEDKINSQTKEKVKCACGTTSYGNAKFCRECGAKVVKKSVAGLEINCLDWHDDDSGYDETAANTFFPIFVNKVVPLLRGQAEGSVTYGEVNDDGEDINNYKTSHFIISDGQLVWCEIQLHPGADAPVFTPNDEYEESDDDEDEDEEDDDR